MLLLFSIREGCCCCCWNNMEDVLAVEVVEAVMQLLVGGNSCGERLKNTGEN